MVLYTCYGCTKEYYNKYDYNRHISKKTSCILIADRFIGKLEEKDKQLEEKNKIIINRDIILKNIIIDSPERVDNNQYITINHQETINDQQKTINNQLKIIKKLEKELSLFKSKNILKIKDIDISTFNKKFKNEYIYIIRLREFVKQSEPIYKIGKTKEYNPLNRLNKYPNGSEIIIITSVLNCDFYERYIIKEFSNIFIRRKDLGTEYFEGDVNKMKNFFLKL